MALSVDSTIGALLADEQAKAILEKHLPGLSGHPQLSMAMGMSLRAVAPMSGGLVTDAILVVIDENLGKL